MVYCLFCFFLCYELFLNEECLSCVLKKKLNCIENVITGQSWRAVLGYPVCEHVCCCFYFHLFFPMLYGVMLLSI